MQQVGGLGRRRCALPLGALLLLLGAGAAAQEEEVDRQVEPASRLDERPAAGPSPSPSPSPRGPTYVPEEFDPSGLPSWEPPPPEPEERPPSWWDRVELSLEGKTSLSAGWDGNVFRADRRPTHDGFGHLRAEQELLVTWPHGAETIVELSGDGLFYFERDNANEYFGSAFLEYFQSITGWLDAGIQNTFEASRQNLLDDNGDLFPRGRFGSVDEEPRLYGILRAGPDLALEVGTSFRWKDYEENDGVESLDYRELHLDTAVSYRLARQPRSRLKLRYRFRRRDYRELLARERDGTLQSGAPELDLRRHQLSLTWYQELEAGETSGRVILGLGGAFNHDLYQNDRSYRQGSASLKFEWWFWKEWTRADAGLSLVARDFVVRQPSGRGGTLRHRLLDLSLGFWQRLAEDVPLAAFAQLAFTAWRSKDPGQDYDRLVLQAGLELFW